VVEPIDALVEPIDAFVKPIDAFVKPIDAFVKPINALIEPIDALVEEDRQSCLSSIYTVASSFCLANIPGVYAVMVPVNADAATVSGEASHSLPGPERPL
jgi:hypothetical protein